MRRSWIVALPLVLGALSSCDGRPRAASGSSSDGRDEPRRGPTLAVLDLSAGAPEKPQVGILGVVPRRQAFNELVQEIERAGKDANVKGVFVRFGSASVGMARAMEVGELLESLVKSGRPVWCHADGLTNATLYAAARGCSQIWLSPAGEVEAIGLASQVVYMRKLLAEHLKLSIDILQVGKFKGAEEPLTRDGPSDEARASLEGTLAGIRTTWLEGVQKGRKLASPDTVEDGPYAPDEAKQKGLVDEIGYWDDAREAAKKAVAAVREDTRFGPTAGPGRSSDLSDVLRAFSSEPSAPIALVRATGSISMGGGGGLFGGSGGITEREMTRLLQRIERDDDVKALVLRIDSPGGSALASDLIWHGLMKVRAKKPIVVSVGDMAASGGYYLSSTASFIFAEPGSIVGSIGVVGGKIGAGKALETIGVHAETFPAKKGDPKAAARAGYLSLLTEWDDPTRVRVRATMESIYRLFLERVAEGRKKKVADIAPSAEGRIFGGQEALSRGLVDALGGLHEAIAKARELAALADDARVFVVGGKGGFLDALSEGDDLEEESRAAVARAQVRPVDVVEATLPELAPFVTSLLPLAQGERALTALPFSIVVR